MRYNKLSILLIIFICGCAPKLVNPTYTATGQEPSLNEERTVSVGMPIFSQWNYVARKVAAISSSVSKSYIMNRVNIQAGAIFVYTVMDGAGCYCSTTRIVTDFINEPVAGACFYPGPGNTFTQLHINHISRKTFDLDSPVPYVEKDLMVGAGGFKYELIYMGRSEDTIKVVYREYLGNIVRPAFTQEISYTLDSSPTTVSFRTLRMSIIKADNNSITYAIISGLQ